MTSPPINRKNNNHSMRPDLTPIVYDAGTVVHINGYIIPPDCKSSNRIQIARRTSQEGVERWAIINGNTCLSKAEQCFVFESMPSNRTDEFIDDTRFDSVDEAYAFLTKWRQAEVERVEKLGYKVWPHKKA